MDVDYQHFRSIHSTNTWSVQNAPLLSRKKLTVVSADEQTAGRGRSSNRWMSPAFQNIYATFCLYFPKSVNAAHFPQLLALAVIETLIQEGINAKIKWPNDITVGQKKIGGILSQTLDFGKERFIAVGLGLNINMPKHDIEKIGQAATSMLLELGQESNIMDILNKIILSFSKKADLFLKKGFASFLPDLKRETILNQEISFKDSAQTIHKGIGIDISEDGSFKLMKENGEILVFYSGEFIES